MTSQISKTAYKIILGAFILGFTVVACNNNKGGDKKEPMNDSPKMDSGDTLHARPTDPGTTPKPPTN